MRIAHFVLFKQKALGFPSMRLASLNQYKAIHDIIQHIQPYLKKIQFVEKSKTIIYHAFTSQSAAAPAP